MRSDSDTGEIASLAGEVLALARDDILMHLRFFAPALAAFLFKEQPGMAGFASDGSNCLYDAAFVLKCYQKKPEGITRIYLHMLLHSIFSHNFRSQQLEPGAWNLATDLAVEHVILELGLEGAMLPEDRATLGRLETLKQQAGGLTAERLYRYFIRNPLPPGEERELVQLSFRDRHDLWKQEGNADPVMEQWRKLSQQVKTELRSFAGAKHSVKSLEQNLGEATREQYDYGEILRRFAVSGEELTVSQEEFDYIYYTYGLTHYGNLPLIEPLEYRESKKVREFVIAIDTSASCDGDAVKAFLRKTYSLLKGYENFFTKFNIHILQCDNQVQSDRKLTCEGDLEMFLQEGKLTGFGATDFRPVFQYVEKLRDSGEFENLKGLLYFTDGYGIYPERMPDYQVIFAFLEEDENRGPVPPWSMKVIV